MSLTRSRDRKVTNAVSPNGKTPTIANTFGLPAGIEFSCPGATSFCSRICYAGKLEKIYKGVRNILTDNLEQLVNAESGEMVSLISNMISEFRADCDKRDAPKLFRIHWDGDFFSPVYTAAWSKVIQAYPDVQFWVYTRVAPSALFLHSMKLDNLALYFSADPRWMTIGRSNRHLPTMLLDCAGCHNTISFTNTTGITQLMIHNTGYPTVMCKQCHNGQYTGYGAQGMSRDHPTTVTRNGVKVVVAQVDCNYPGGCHSPNSPSFNN